MRSEKEKVWSWERQMILKYNHFAGIKKCIMSYLIVSLQSTTSERLCIYMWLQYMEATSCNSKLLSYFKIIINKRDVLQTILETKLWRRHNRNQIVIKLISWKKYVPRKDGSHNHPTLLTYINKKVSIQ